MCDGSGHQQLHRASRCECRGDMSDRLAARARRGVESERAPGAKATSERADGRGPWGARLISPWCCPSRFVSVFALLRQKRQLQPRPARCFACRAFAARLPELANALYVELAHTASNPGAADTSNAMESLLDHGHDEAPHRLRRLEHQRVRAGSKLSGCACPSRSSKRTSTPANSAPRAGKRRRGGGATSKCRPTAICHLGSQLGRPATKRHSSRRLRRRTANADARNATSYSTRRRTAQPPERLSRGSRLCLSQHQKRREFDQVLRAVLRMHWEQGWSCWPHTEIRSSDRPKDRC